MNSSKWGSGEIELAKQISGYIIVGIIVLVVILIGVLFGWAAFFCGLILLCLFLFWGIRVMIKNAEEVLKKEEQ